MARQYFNFGQFGHEKEKAGSTYKNRASYAEYFNFKNALTEAPGIPAQNGPHPGCSLRCGGKSADQGTDFFAQDHPAEVVRTAKIENDDRHFIIHAQREGG